jgi:hypothetical protein
MNTYYFDIFKYIKKGILLSEVVKGREDKIDWENLIRNESIPFDEIIEYKNYFDIFSSIFVEKYFFSIYESYCLKEENYFSKTDIFKMIENKIEYSLKEFEYTYFIHRKHKELKLSNHSLFLFDLTHLSEDHMKLFYYDKMKEITVIENILNYCFKYENSFMFEILLKSLEKDTIRVLSDIEFMSQFNDKDFSRFISIINLKTLDFSKVDLIFTYIFILKFSKDLKLELLNYIPFSEIKTFLIYGNKTFFQRMFSSDYYFLSAFNTFNSNGTLIEIKNVREEF